MVNVWKSKSNKSMTACTLFWKTKGYVQLLNQPGVWPFNNRRSKRGMTRAVREKRTRREKITRRSSIAKEFETDRWGESKEESQNNIRNSDTHDETGVESGFDDANFLIARAIRKLDGSNGNNAGASSSLLQRFRDISRKQNQTQQQQELHVDKSNTDIKEEKRRRRRSKRIWF